MKTCIICERSYIYYENKIYPGKSLTHCSECQIKHEEKSQNAK